VANEAQELDNFILDDNSAGCLGQTSTNPKLVTAEATSPEPSVNSYTVLGATSEQETLVRDQIRIMQPDVYPLRVLFVSHWKYVERPEPFASMCPLIYQRYVHAPTQPKRVHRQRPLCER